MAIDLGGTGALASSWAAQIENRHDGLTQATQAGADRFTATVEGAFNGVLGDALGGGDEYGDHDFLVTRATGIANRLMFQGGESERPGMTFAMPWSEAGVEAGPEPGATATEPTAPTPSGRARHAPRAKHADPGAVADRVYDLMRQELTLARLRGGR